MKGKKMIESKVFKKFLDALHENPEPIYKILEPAKNKGEYICPACGHGTHGDGIKITETGKYRGRWQCFSCRAKGDGIDLYRLKKGVDRETAIKEVEELYGFHFNGKTTEVKTMPIKFDDQKDQEERQVAAPATTPAETSAAAPAATEPDQEDPEDIELTAAELNEKREREQLEIIARDLEESQKHTGEPAYIAYLDKRGLSRETAARFNIGFLPAWKHPKNIISGKKAPATQRLIIPTSQESYTARDIRNEVEKQYRYMKAGSAHFLNFDCIRDEKPVYLVEGEIDALSFVEIGENAIALGSVIFVKKFVEQLKTVHRNNPVTANFIIALDQDEPGIKAAKELEKGLEHLDIDCIKADTGFLFNGKKDANELLTTDRETFTARARETAAQATESARKKRLKEIETQSNAAYLDSLRESFTAAKEPIETGFSYLDDLLDGGLFPGLYIIGGVSSSGKTAFAMQIVDNVAKSGGDCIVFAAEMSRADLIARSVSRETVEQKSDLYKFTQRDIQNGYRHNFYSPEQKKIINAAWKTYGEYAHRITVYENETPDSMKPSEIRKRIERYCQISKTRPLVVVDYLQILTPENDRQDIRQSIDATIRALKAIATKFSLPVIVVSSLNRENYTAPLNLAAFKESGNIEYGADCLLGLQFTAIREQYQTTKSGLQTEIQKSNMLSVIAEEKNKMPRKVEITILKQRGGKSSGIVTFDFYARYNRYEQNQTEKEFQDYNYPGKEEDPDIPYGDNGGHKYSIDDTRYNIAKPI